MIYLMLLGLSLELFAACEDFNDLDDIEELDGTQTQLKALYLPGVFDQEAFCDDGPALWNTYTESTFSGWAYSIEAVIAQLAINWNGLSPRGSCKDDYRSIILDTSPGTGDQYGFENTSSCALAVAGIWRVLGITDKEIWGTYDYGIDKDLESIARRYNAFHKVSDSDYISPDPEQLLKMGNVIGVPFNNGWNTHYFTISSPAVWNPYTKRWEFNGINGGSRTSDNKYYQISNVPMSARFDGTNWHFSRYTWTNQLWNFWGQERTMTFWISTNNIPRRGHMHTPFPVEFKMLQLKRPVFEVTATFGDGQL